MPTKISWADETWNPISGCSKISVGCKNCYAERMSKRLAGRHGYPPAPHNFDVTWHQGKLDKPLRWRKPRRIFVCSMSDLFHKDVQDEWTVQVFAMMALCDWHIFQILTKRPNEIMYYFGDGCFWAEVEATAIIWALRHGWKLPVGHFDDERRLRHPLPNVWLGVTAENQSQMEKRAWILKGIPAAVRFVSIEPMLEQIYLPSADFGLIAPGLSWLKGREIHWVIAGAETGPGARPMDLGWARSVRDQCQAAGVPFFFKRDSDGNRHLDGRLWEEFPG